MSFRCLKGRGGINAASKASVGNRGAIFLEGLGADPVKIRKLGTLTTITAEEQVLPIVRDPRPVLLGSRIYRFVDVPWFGPSTVVMPEANVKIPEHFGA